MRKVRAERKTWLRGKPNFRDSFLLDKHGSRCCVGIYLQACGVPDNEMLNVAKASEVDNLPKEASWLVSDEGIGGSCSDAACELYAINDEDHERQRADHRELERIFYANGVDFKFQGRGAPDIKMYHKKAGDWT